MNIFKKPLKAVVSRLKLKPKACILGLLDASVCISYILAIPAPIWYAGVLVGKMILAKKYGASKTRLLHLTPFIVLVSISLLYTALSDGENLTEVINIGGFIISLAMSVSLLRKEETSEYIYFMALVGFTTATTYLMLASVNLIPDHYGRLMFFNGSHPNLGGETFAIFTVAALLSFKRAGFWLSWIPLTAGIYLMQARAALLVAIAVLAIYLWWQLKSSGRNKLTYIMLIFAVTISSLILSGQYLLTSLENIFLMSDESRGMGTGFVGREERWGQALDIFYENPFLGGGFAAFDKEGLLTPHNYFLAGISYMGMLSIPLFAYLFACIFRAYKSNKHTLIAFSPLLILMIFNDRFLNMNPYPFTAYVIIFVLSSRTAGLKPTTSNNL